jgi:hypothetical protein
MLVIRPKIVNFGPKISNKLYTENEYFYLNIIFILFLLKIKCLWVLNKKNPFFFALFFH